MLIRGFVLITISYSFCYQACSVTVTDVAVCHVYWPCIMHFTNRCLRSIVIFFAGIKDYSKKGGVTAATSQTLGLHLFICLFLLVCHFSKLLGIRLYCILHFPITRLMLHIISY